MVKIFISHSSQDKPYVAELEKAIHRELGSNIEIFASSLPKAIPSGSDWLDTVMDSLENADILILLKTRSAENSVWVGFELGYFWKKTNKKNIFLLYHPKARLMNPVDTLQAKSIFEKAQLENFFEELCKVCGISYSQKVDINEIIGYATDYIIDPMAERSLERFEHLIENAEWSKHSFDDLDTTWICMEDLLFQITHNADSDVITEDFKEPWANKFPDPHASSYRVNLKIGGVTVYQEVFVSIDTGRYFVPLPEQYIVPNQDRSDAGEQEFFWVISSLKFKLGKLIGRFHFRGYTIYDFARLTNIQIVDEPLK